ncbi:MAG TPA: hypothetical protein VIJ76_00190 [Galbitalea sp.]
MTLRKDSQKPPQTHTQKIVMWCIYCVAAALLVGAGAIFLVSGTPLF